MSGYTPPSFNYGAPNFVIDPATGQPVGISAEQPVQTPSTPNSAASIGALGALGYGASEIPGLFGSSSAAAPYGFLTNPATGEAIGTAAAAPTATAAAASPWALSGIGSAGNFILPGLGAVGAADLAIRRPGGLGGAAQGAASGAAIGSFGGPTGAVIGAGIGGLAGGLNKATGKDQDQLGRDQMRSVLQQSGFLDEGFNIGLADGTKFNMGLDGGAQLKNWDGKSARPMYNTDGTNPMTHQTVGWINPLAELLAGKSQKLQNDLAGYMTNAAMSNATTLEGVRSNVMAMMQKLGLDETKIRSGLSQMLQAGDITQQEHDAYQYGINTLLTGDPAKYEFTLPNEGGKVVNLGPGGAPVPAVPTPTSILPQPIGGPVLKMAELASNLRPSHEVTPQAPAPSRPLATPNPSMINQNPTPSPGRIPPQAPAASAPPMNSFRSPASHGFSGARSRDEGGTQGFLFKR